MKKPLEWFDTHPFKSIIAYTILIAGAVFAYSKFYLIENTQLDFNAQLETKDVIISQLEMRIKFLENENSRLESDLDRYEDWLRNTPGTLEYIKAENEKLKQQIDNDKSASDIENTSSEFIYSQAYNSIKENRSIIDEKSGIVVSMKDISVAYDGTLSIWGPGNEMEIVNDVAAGFTKELVVNSVRYQVSVTMIDYVSDSYSILIRQLDE